MTPPRILAIIGSGETAPTMTSVHAELFERAGSAGAAAVMLDTPFGFQENADELAARTVAYFRDSVRRRVEVATFRDAATATPLQYAQMCARVAEAGWVFAGPGSPTYAIRQWIGTRVPELLAEKLSSGGVVVMSSAAAVGLGELALPVYEIYKVGMMPAWIGGIDLMRGLGLPAVVIPHYDNAEGGTHDTRFCYMGERRLRLLEETLPDDCLILGVDEHTACIVDVESGTLSVRGRGRLIRRQGGVERHWRAGEVVALDEFVAAGDRPGRAAVRADTQQPIAAAAEADPFMEEVADQRAAALAALSARDPDAAAAAILAMEASVHAWSLDALQSDASDRAREALRELVVRLADMARSGVLDPRDRAAPFVDAMLGLRERARADRRFADADALRAALASAGVSVRDTAHGSEWDLDAGSPD